VVIIKGITPLVFAFLLITSSQLSAKGYYLYVKPCIDCGWFQYLQPFRLREQCEIARSGIFVRGMTKCLKEED
jgi:hypothetical protein